jgi:hypothetical protein
LGYRQKIRSSVWIVKQIVKFWQRQINLSQTDGRRAKNYYDRLDCHVNG